MSGRLDVGNEQTERTDTGRGADEVGAMGGQGSEPERGAMKNKTFVLAAAAVVVLALSLGGWWLLGRSGGDGADTAAEGANATLNQSQRRTRAEHVRDSIERHRRLWRESDFAQVRKAAIDGDPVAQRRLSEIFEDCQIYGGQMSMSLRLLGNLAKADPSVRPTVNAIYNDYKRFCVAADAELRRSPEAANDWLHRSAKAGDLASEMRFVARAAGSVSPGQMRYFVGRLRETGDPDAIFEMSLLLGKTTEPWSEPSQADAFNSEIAQAAWMLAACRAGFDCARGSRVLNAVCLSMFACHHADYARYVWDSQAGDAQRADLTRRLALIERDLLQQAPKPPPTPAPAPSAAPGSAPAPAPASKP